MITKMEFSFSKAERGRPKADRAKRLLIFFKSLIVKILDSALLSGKSVHLCLGKNLEFSKETRLYRGLSV